MEDVGFSDVKHGYQGATPKASRGAPRTFSDKNIGVFRCWLIVSARK
jgi:hypothetical protein